MKVLPNYGSSLKLVAITKAKWKILSVSIMVSLMISLNVSTAKADFPGIDVAEGYELEFVASKAPGEADVPRPTQIAFDRISRNLYILYSSGRISVLDVHTGFYGDDVLPPGIFSPSGLPPLASYEVPLGFAVHPKTGKLYVGSGYVEDDTLPTTGEPGALNVKSRIYIVDPADGSMETFVEGLPSFWMGATNMRTGCQGMEFDSYGNLYVAQTMNDAVRLAGVDPNHSAILKIDKDGNISVFASGLRASYDVVVAKEGKNGTAPILYAGDNGDPSELMYYDELNRVIFGKHYGWPEQPAPPVLGSHIGPLWNFDKDPVYDRWKVPTGIDILKGTWGEKVEDPLFLGLMRGSYSTNPARKHQGTIEMFTGIDYTDRITLATNVHGPIDVRVGHCEGKKLYFVEYLTGDVYSIAPEN